METREQAGQVEVVPPQWSFLDFEYSLNEEFTINQLSAEAVGDLHRGEFELEMETGRARYTLIAGPRYFMDWGSYSFGEGLSSTAQLKEPFIEMHFQMHGDVHLESNDMVFDVAAGESTMLYVPTQFGEFQLGQRSEGATFEILFHPDYFQELAERYPALFEPYLDRLRKQDVFWLSNQPIHITPAMRVVIERLQHKQLGNAANSLFLEGQILELLALQLTQASDQRYIRKGMLKPADVDKMYEARNLLLANIANPPSLGELARSVGTNEFALKRDFKQVFKTSPYAMLLQHKLEVARNYLLDTRMPIAEISQIVGYSDPAHFSNAFRKHFGRPPSKYRA